MNETLLITIIGACLGLGVSLISQYATHRFLFSRDKSLLRKQVFLIDPVSQIQEYLFDIETAVKTEIADRQLHFSTMRIQYQRASQAAAGAVAGGFATMSLRNDIDTLYRMYTGNSKNIDFTTKQKNEILDKANVIRETLHSLLMS